MAADTSSAAAANNPDVGAAAAALAALTVEPMRSRSVTTDVMISGCTSKDVIAHPIPL